ncbi:MAG: hypothetical protein WCN27_02085, partial [Alphaproteobacteria bacterium]
SNARPEGPFKFLFVGTVSFPNCSGNLIEDILKSLQPQDHHFDQIGDLVRASNGLEGYLKYHRELSAKLGGWSVLPLAEFLNVRFLPPEAIEVKRRQILGEVGAIFGSIPLGDGGHPLDSIALHKFMDKIFSSIQLPSQVSFSEEEIASILKDIGLLLETDKSGNIIINSDYFDVIGELVDLFNAITKAMQEKAADAFEANKPLIERVRQAILTNNMADASLRAFTDLCATLDQNVALPARGFLNLVEKLAHIAPSVELSNQDDKPLTDILTGRGGCGGGGGGGCGGGGSSAGPDLRAFRAVLFLMQTFAKAQYEALLNKSILGSTLKLDVQSALGTYYGRPIEEVKVALTDFSSEHFALDPADYAALKKSENVSFMKRYLDALMAKKPVKADLVQLKTDVLGISANDAVKSAVVLRACEFLALDTVSSTIASEKKDWEEKEERAKNTARKEGKEYTAKTREERKKIEQIMNVKKAEEVSRIVSSFNASPVITNAMLSLKILRNNLAAEGDRSTLMEAYLSLDNGMDLRGKIDRLRDFFAQILVAGAKHSDFVTTSLSLPTLKTAYHASYQALGRTLVEFVGYGEALGNLTRFADAQLGKGSEKHSIVTKHFGKLAKLLKISDDFAHKGDETGAIEVSHGSVEKDTSFKVLAGLQTLEFTTLCTTRNYFTSFYNASKILHSFELMMPSDNDFAFLKQALTEGLDADHQAIADIDRMIELAKSVKTNAVNFFGQIKNVMRFVELFKELKDKYDSPGGGDGFDLYRSIDALSPDLPPVDALVAVVQHRGGVSSSISSAPPPPPGLGKVPPPPGLGAMGASLQAPSVANILGAKEVVFSDARMLKEFDVKEIDLHTRLFGSRFSLQTAKPDEKERVSSAKIAGYDRLLQSQMTHFSAVDFTKIDEANAVHFVRQLMGMIDLYLRMLLSREFEPVLSGRVKAEKGDDMAIKTFIGDFKAKGGVFKSDFLNILNKYKIETIMKCYKNPLVITEDDTDQLFSLLANANPALKSVIANAIFAILQGVDLASPGAKSVDVTGQIMPAIDAYLDLGNPAKRGAKDTLTPAALDSIISIKVPKDKAH